MIRVARDVDSLLKVAANRRRSQKQEKSADDGLRRPRQQIY
jgi:hypothetical protein